MIRPYSAEYWVMNMILLFPVSVFWAVLFGFWLPGLAAMQTLFPVLQQTYGIEVRSIPRPAAPEKPLTAQEQKKQIGRAHV